MGEQLVGKVIHYWSNIGVAGIDITDSELKVGDEIIFRGHTTDFKQTVESMQIEKDSIESAKKGTSVGMKVAQRVREHDNVYKVMPD